jgi:GT2 family glycosyltransferase
MGIRRHVFDRIPGFDTDLGPGMTGLGEDTLLWMQMVELGMCILPVADAEVIHYPDMSRFDHSGWADAARRLGRTNAYIWHHWKHLRIPKACIDEYWTRMKLHLRNLVQLRDKSMREGCSGWELSYRIRMESLKAFREMTDHPRKYPSPNERLRSMSCK